VYGHGLAIETTTKNIGSVVNTMLRWICVCCSVLAINAWVLRPVSFITAKTTVRLWQELHVATRTAHSFSELLAPTQKTGDFFLGAVNHQEIRALVLCHRESISSVSLVKVANPPDHLNSPIQLLRLLQDTHVNIDYNLLKSQPIWYFEALYMYTEREVP